MDRNAARRWLITGSFAFAILFGALCGALFVYRGDLPQVSVARGLPAEHHHPGLRRRRQLLGEFAIERRVVVAFKDIPPVLRNAIVAVEDADFWKHLGHQPLAHPRRRPRQPARRAGAAQGSPP